MIRWALFIRYQSDRGAEKEAGREVEEGTYSADEIPAVEIGIDQEAVRR